MRSEVASDDVLIESLQSQIEARPNKHGKSSNIRLQIDETSNSPSSSGLRPTSSRYLASLLSREAKP